MPKTYNALILNPTQSQQPSCSAVRRSPSRHRCAGHLRRARWRRRGTASDAQSCQLAGSASRTPLKDAEFQAFFERERRDSNPRPPA
jgi:hypothetical protein